MESETDTIARSLPAEGKATLNLEHLVAGIAVVTALYYVLSFAFELGFFWRMGLELISAFELGEHVVHAAALAIPLIGVAVIGYMGLMYPAVFVPRGVFAEPAYPGDKSLPYPKLDWITGFASVALLALMAFSFFISTFREIRAEGFLPGNLAVLFGALATTLFVVRRHLHLDAMLWAYPAVIAAIVLPVAAGQWHYEATVSRTATVPVKLGDRVVQAVPVFLGRERGIFRTGDRLSLFSYDGSFTLDLGSDARLHLPIKGSAGRIPATTKSRPAGEDTNAPLAARRPGSQPTGTDPRP